MNWNEIETEGRKTTWDFDLFDNTGQKKMIFTREGAEKAFAAGFVFLESPVPTPTQTVTPTQMGSCSRCGTPTKLAHLERGLCPLCLEDN